MSASLIGGLGSSAFRLSTSANVDVAHGLVLLFGIGTRALPRRDSMTRWNNLLGGLAVNRTAGTKRTYELTSSIVPRGTSFHRFSNRRSGIKRFQTIHQCKCRCRSRARASLRNRHQGPSTMGFDDEVEQSFGRPCRQTDGWSKRTCELTSSIVPRGTSFHRSVELEFSPIGFDPARFSYCCRGLFPGPAELGAVNPYAV